MISFFVHYHYNIITFSPTTCPPPSSQSLRVAPLPHLRLLRTPELPLKAVQVRSVVMHGLHLSHVPPVHLTPIVAPPPVGDHPPPPHRHLEPCRGLVKDPLHPPPRPTTTVVRVRRRLPAQFIRVQCFQCGVLLEALEEDEAPRDARIRPRRLGVAVQELALGQYVPTVAMGRGGGQGVGGLDRNTDTYTMYLTKHVRGTRRLKSEMRPDGVA